MSRSIRGCNDDDEDEVEDDEGEEEEAALTVASIVPSIGSVGCQTTAELPEEFTMGIHASICDGPPLSNLNLVRPSSLRSMDGRALAAGAMP